MSKVLALLALVLAAVVYSLPVEDDWIETSHPAKDNVNVRDVLMSDTSTDEEFKAAIMIAIDNFKVPDDEVFLRAAHIVAHERFSDDTALGRMLIENQLPTTAAAAAAMAKEIKAALVKVKQIFLAKCKDLVEFLLKGMKAAWEAIKLALKQATFTQVKGLYCAFCEASILFMITCAAASGGPFTQAVIGAIPTVSWAAGMVKTGAGAIGDAAGYLGTALKDKGTSIMGFPAKADKVADKAAIIKDAAAAADVMSILKKTMCVEMLEFTCAAVPAMKNFMKCPANSLVPKFNPCKNAAFANENTIVDAVDTVLCINSVGHKSLYGAGTAPPKCMPDASEKKCITFKEMGESC